MDDGEPGEKFSNPEIDASNTAFFFDLDGTLAEIVEDPGQVRLEAAVLEALGQLRRMSNGALAVVSGRPIVVLDRLLSPLKLPLSGVHGLEWRTSDGEFRRTTYNAALLQPLHQNLRNFACAHDGLIVEQKPGSVALHYRKRPELEGACLGLARKLAACDQSIKLMHGKMVIELRLGGRSKADAVSEFMAQEPFRGRTPLFAGDDVTDEDAFRLVEEMGGIGIKVGAGETAASLRTADRTAFETWLCQLAASGKIAGNDFSGGKKHRAAPLVAAANSGA